MKLTPLEKATRMIKKYAEYVHGYVGSSMLTNTEYPETIQSNAQKLSIQVCNEMLYELEDLPRIPYNERRTKFWQDVKTELENINP